LSCSVSEGVVSATLPSTCYDVPGRGGITVFLTSDSQKTAIYAAIATVTRTESGSVAPPATQDVVDLINAIAAAVATIPASYSDLMADIAPTYSSSSLYAVGQYAWYDGDLKKCIVPITTAESYTAAHWISAVLGNDVCSLSAITDNLARINLIEATTKANITFSPDPCGRIDANGVSNNTTIQVVTDDIVLQSGEYTIGCFPSIADTGLKLQVMDYNNNKVIAESTLRTTFTVPHPDIFPAPSSETVKP
jgi:hypothetical protein